MENENTEQFLHQYLGLSGATTAFACCSITDFSVTNRIQIDSVRMGLVHKVLGKRSQRQKSRLKAARNLGAEHKRLGTKLRSPKFGNEGAPDAWLDLTPAVSEGLQGIAVGQEIIVITWFHEARRDVLKLHPRWDKNIPLTGVFNTRSPDRPNPLGLHRVKVLEIAGNQLKVVPIEAIDRDAGHGHQASALAASRLVKKRPLAFMPRFPPPPAPARPGNSLRLRERHTAAVAASRAQTSDHGGRSFRRRLRPVGGRPCGIQGDCEQSVFTPKAPTMTRDQMQALWEGQTLLRRLPTLAEIANAADFLASDQAGAMTGTVANLTCGATLD
jgi:tRNA (Thr-GGU) A37 N-methylase